MAPTKQKASYFRKCLDKKSAYSAQRLAGLAGWLFVIIFLMISMLWGFEIPASFELFMVMSAALLGLDTLAEIVRAFKGSSELLDLENPFTGETVTDMCSDIERAIESDSEKADIVTGENFSYLDRSKRK